MKNPFLELTGLDLWSRDKSAPVLPDSVSARQVVFHFSNFGISHPSLSLHNSSSVVPSLSTILIDDEGSKLYSMRIMIDESLQLRGVVPWSALSAQQPRRPQKRTGSSLSKRCFSGSNSELATNKRARVRTANIGHTVHRRPCLPDNFPTSSIASATGIINMNRRVWAGERVDFFRMGFSSTTSGTNIVMVICGNRWRC